MEKTKAEKMYALVDQWRASGKTQKVFCGEHDIKVGTVGWWVARKKRGEGSDSGFALVDMAGQPGSGKVEISYSNVSRVTSIPHLSPLVFPTPGPIVFPRQGQ